MKTLIRLGGCPGWSESLLAAQSFCWFCQEATHLNQPAHPQELLSSLAFEYSSFNDSSLYYPLGINQTDVQADLRLRCSHMAWDRFSRCSSDKNMLFLLLKGAYSFSSFLNHLADIHMEMTCNVHMGHVKRIWYLSPMRAAKVQASVRIRAVSPEPPLLAHTSSESWGTFRQKARSLAPLNGWACALKICHDGMLEDTNSLDAVHIVCVV